MSQPPPAVALDGPPVLEWRRLDPRMLLIHPVTEVGKALPAIIGAFLAGHGSGNDSSGSRWSTCARTRS